MARAVLESKYEKSLMPLFSEINAVVKNAVKDERDDLNPLEVEYLLKISGRMVRELRKEIDSNLV